MRPQFRRTWQFASNAHAYRLYIFNDPTQNSSFRARLAAISEALDYRTDFKDLSNFGVIPRTKDSIRHQPSRLGRSLALWHTNESFVNTDEAYLQQMLPAIHLSERPGSSKNAVLTLKAKRPNRHGWAFLGCKSLTMTYFHTGTRTIIGAEA
ncbi:hypothetical protein QTH91_00005, partial [Variovorax dokdonensis]